MTAHELALSVVAVSGEAKKSGPLGLAVILVLCVACYFLFKSMSKHLRKVREEFPDGSAAAPAAEQTAAPGQPAAPSEDVAATPQPVPDQPDGPADEQPAG